MEGILPDNHSRQTRQVVGRKAPTPPKKRRGWPPVETSGATRTGTPGSGAEMKSRLGRAPQNLVGKRGDAFLFASQVWHALPPSQRNRKIPAWFSRLWSGGTRVVSTPSRNLNIKDRMLELLIRFKYITTDCNVSAHGEPRGAFWVDGFVHSPERPDWRSLRRDLRIIAKVHYKLPCLIRPLTMVTTKLLKRNASYTLQRTGGPQR